MSTSMEGVGADAAADAAWGGETVADASAPAELVGAAEVAADVGEGGVAVDDAPVATVMVG